MIFLAVQNVISLIYLIRIHICFVDTDMIKQMLNIRRYLKKMTDTRGC